MIAQLVMLLYGVILCGVNIVFGPDKSLEFTQCTSLCFLGGNDIEAWVRIPLAAVNIFEILYWIMMSLCVGKLCGTKYGISFKFVMFSYGTGYLFYITLIMFLMLYLTQDETNKHCKVGPLPIGDWNGWASLLGFFKTQF